MLRDLGCGDLKTSPDSDGNVIRYWDPFENQSVAIIQAAKVVGIEVGIIILPDHTTIPIHLHQRPT